MLNHINEEAVTAACFTLRGARELERLGADCEMYARNNEEILERSIGRECERLMKGVSYEIGNSVKCAIQEGIAEVRERSTHEAPCVDRQANARAEKSEEKRRDRVTSESEEESDAEVRHRYGGARKSRRRARRRARADSPGKSGAAPRALEPTGTARVTPPAPLLLIAI